MSECKYLEGALRDGSFRAAGNPARQWRTSPIHSRGAIPQMQLACNSQLQLIEKQLPVSPVAELMNVDKAGVCEEANLVLKSSRH